jgi:hypothetical protein
MAFPEHPENFFEADDSRIKYYEYNLGVTSVSAAYFLVSRINRRAAGVANCSCVYALDFPEATLCSPKAPETDYYLLHVCGERRLYRLAVNEMTCH